MRAVRFYLDFVSPYTWLALMRAEAFAREHGMTWELRPVVYSALLDATGLVGPVEVPAKRRYTFHDVARSAERLGLRLTGPPEHPFRSLDALRTLCLYRDDPRALPLAVRLADACWGEGRALTDPAVLEDAVARAGLDPGNLASRIADPPNKEALRDSTAEAVRRGAFGVPTFVFEDELFWGHDRMDSLADRLDGRPAPAQEVVARLLARPSGTERPRRPRQDDAPA